MFPSEGRSVSQTSQVTIASSLLSELESLTPPVLLCVTVSLPQESHRTTGVTVQTMF